MPVLWKEVAYMGGRKRAAWEGGGGGGSDLHTITPLPHVFPMFYIPPPPTATSCASSMLEPVWGGGGSVVMFSALHIVLPAFYCLLTPLSLEKALCYASLTLSRRRRPARKEGGGLLCSGRRCTALCLLSACRRRRRYTCTALHDLVSISLSLGSLIHPTKASLKKKKKLSPTHRRLFSPLYILLK